MASNATASTFPAGTGSGVVLPSNARRAGATLYNEGAAEVYVALGPVATLTAYSVRMAVSGYLELPYNWRGAVSAITAAGTSTLRVVELVA